MMPILSAKNESRDFYKLTDFIRRLIAVPDSKVRDQSEAENKAKRTSGLPPPALPTPNLSLAFVPPAQLPPQR